MQHLLAVSLEPKKKKKEEEEKNIIIIMSLFLVIRHSKTVGDQTIMLKHQIKQKKNTHKTNILHHSK